MVKYGVLKRSLALEEMQIGTCLRLFGFVAVSYTTRKERFYSGHISYIYFLSHLLEALEYLHCKIWRISAYALGRFLCANLLTRNLASSTFQKSLIWKLQEVHKHQQKIVREKRVRDLGWPGWHGLCRDIC